MIHKKIEVVPYNEAWPQMFLLEKQMLEEALGGHCLCVHHIGSSAVPGLCAKDSIDVICVVDSLSSSLKLQKNGYIFKGELNVPMRYFFSKNTSGSKVNLHVCENHHGFIALNLHFRDLLRHDLLLRQQYAELKHELLQDDLSHLPGWKGFPRYNLGKNKFIKDALKQSGFNEFCIKFCLHDLEWEAFQKYSSLKGYTEKIVDNEYNYYFCLYKGSAIVSVAHVVIQMGVALLRFIADQESGCHAKRLLSQIRNWCKLHNYTLNGNDSSANPYTP